MPELTVLACYGGLQVVSDVADVERAELCKTPWQRPQRRQPLQCAIVFDRFMARPFWDVIPLQGDEPRHSLTCRWKFQAQCWATMNGYQYAYPF